jgi:Flp pilus assembly pilin Flp
VVPTLAGLCRFVRDESAQDLIEYSLLLAFISFAVLALILNFNTSIQTILNDTIDALNIAASAIS